MTKTDRNCQVFMVYIVLRWATNMYTAVVLFWLKLIIIALESVMFEI